MQIQSLARDVYACLQSDGSLGYSNSGCLTGGTGLVIDTFFDLAHTRRMLELYGQVGGDAPAHLVNTHHNGDHCWGNQLFERSRIIGHRLGAEAMQREDPSVLQRLIHGPGDAAEFAYLREKLAPFDFSGIRPTPPDLFVEDELKLDSCDTLVEIHYVGPAHTASDLIVHLPEHRIVFAGDIVFRLCTPLGWEGTYANWFAALDRLIALAPEIIVPGHGPLCGVEGAQEMKAYLTYVLEEAKRQLEADRSVLHAAKTLDLGPYAGWIEPERVIFNLQRAYDELRAGAGPRAFDPLLAFREMQLLCAHWSA